MRRQLGLDGFVFLSVGAMTANKGTELLLKAFAELVQKRPDARLVLKGLDPLHNSRERLQREFAALPFPIRRILQEKVHYIGEQWSMDAMALLYQAADIYVSPYHAEGFNIPVLEAAACGLPLICTGGGPTDDFVTDAFCRKIRARSEPAHYEDVMGRQLFPDLDHLIALMNTTMDDETWRRTASAAGPRHAHEKFNWDAIVDGLLTRLG
jgi:glycosyltransferase involved in cell wall biosynthesis